MIYVIKKDGTREEFNPQKIVAAVNKSAARILYTFSQEEKDFICRFAEEHAASLGKEEIEIQGLNLLGVVPQDETVYEYDCEGRPTASLPEDNPVKVALRGIVDKLGL